MRSERGMILLPFVILISIGILGVFLLGPSVDREEVVEGQRLRQDQARLAAEGAAALALARGEDVGEVKIGRAVASARFAEESGRRVVRASARVPGLRDGFVRREVVAPAD